MCHEYDVNLFLLGKVAQLIDKGLLFLVAVSLEDIKPHRHEVVKDEQPYAHRKEFLHVIEYLLPLVRVVVIIQKELSIHPSVYLFPDMLWHIEIAVLRLI